MKVDGNIMSSAIRSLSLALFAAVLAGCFGQTPYDYAENWVIREDPVRTFVVPSDVIYLQNDLYTSVKRLPQMTTYANSEVGRGRFEGVARVFSPLIVDSKDLEKALDWYFDTHHEKGRPFVFIGEGRGGELLREYENENRKSLVKKGLAASFYTDAAGKGFVTDDMVKAVKHAVLEARYKAVWNREMPKGMLD